MSVSSTKVGSDGKLSLQMEGGNRQKLHIQIEEGKLKVVAVDGEGMESVLVDTEVNSVITELLKIADPNDSDVIGVAKYAADKKGVNMDHVDMGAKLHIAVVDVYFLIFSSEKGKGGDLYLAFVADPPIIPKISFTVHLPFKEW